MELFYTDLMLMNWENYAISEKVLDLQSSTVHSHSKENCISLGILKMIFMEHLT